MKRILASLALLPAIFPVVAGEQRQQRHQQPNILIFFVDDLGWADMGMRNPMYETPNIDHLAEKGLNFHRAYVSTATSSPSCTV